MHVIIMVLGALVSIFYLLDRLGIDIGWLNPFHWAHRRRWAKKYEGDPIHAVEDPLHLAALFVVGVARLDGDLSAEQKTKVLEQFQSNFHLDAREATDLCTSAAHLLGGPQVIESQLDGLLSRNRESFTGEQAESMLNMMSSVGPADSGLSAMQQEFVNKARAALSQEPKSTETWS